MGSNTLINRDHIDGDGRGGIFSYERTFFLTQSCVYYFCVLRVFLSAWKVMDIPLDVRREHLVKMQMGQ